MRLVFALLVCVVMVPAAALTSGETSSGRVIILEGGKHP